MAVCLSACHSGPVVTRSVGFAYEVLVVMDLAQWQGAMGEAVNENLSAPIPYLPQPEPCMKVSYTQPSEFSGFLKLVRNILIVDINPDLYTKVSLSTEKDTWASSQVVLRMKAPNDKSVVDYLAEQPSVLTDYFSQIEMDRAVALLEDTYSSIVMNVLRTKHNLELKVPEEMEAYKDTTDFFWTTNNANTGRMDMVVYTFPYTSKETFTPEYLVAKRDSVTNLLQIGDTQNDEHLTCFAVSETDPNFVADRLGAAVGQIAVSVKADPARPFQTLELTGLSAPRLSDRFSRADRESLLAAGCATFSDTTSATAIERAVTTYIKNSYGATDNSYQDAETLHTLGYVIRFLRTRITSKFGRHKLANDGTTFGEGQAVVTPAIARSELIAAYSELETAGLVENMDLFKENLIVERNATDPNRLDVLFPPDLINQLRVFATLVQFRLQY